MEKKNTNDGIFLTSDLSIEVLDLIKNRRDDLIKDFLDERNLKEYAKSKFNISELSNVKIAFIKQELKDLLLAPVNPEYYGAVINGLKFTADAGVLDEHEHCFYKEIENILKRYIYG